MSLEEHGAAHEQGFVGDEVDQTPNENYTVAGVTSGKPTPETTSAPAAKVREAASSGREREGGRMRLPAIPLPAYDEAAKALRRVEEHREEAMRRSTT